MHRSKEWRREMSRVASPIAVRGFRPQLPLERELQPRSVPTWGWPGQLPWIRCHLQVLLRETPKIGLAQQMDSSFVPVGSSPARDFALRAARHTPLGLGECADLWWQWVDVSHTQDSHRHL